MNEYKHGYHDGYEQGMKAALAKKDIAPGLPQPRLITLESYYPDRESLWSKVQVYQIDFTSGPSRWWNVAAPTTTKKNRRGQSKRSWQVVSDHSTPANAASARAGTGHGIGAG